MGRSLFELWLLHGLALIHCVGSRYTSGDEELLGHVLERS